MYHVNFSDDGGSTTYDKIWDEMIDIIDRLCLTKYKYQSWNESSACEDIMETRTSYQ